MSEPILVRAAVDECIAQIVLSNPPANTYSYAMMRQLDTAILAARMDADVHVIVIRGEGDKFFCAGADIAMLVEADPTFKYYFCLHANETLMRLEQTPKLVIAALNGHCVGGGLEIAMAADLRVAKRDGGKIGLPEVSLGVLPGTGGTQRLVRMLGRAKAIELMATGRTFGFDEGQSLGLIDEIVDAGEFDAKVTEYARGVVPPGRASRAVGHIKRAVQTGADLSLADGLALERELQQRLFESDDAREGLAAYVEKRKARFTGR